MAKYIDVCIFPLSKKSLTLYKKNTLGIGKILLKHGAFSSSDFVADDENALKLFFPKFIKVKPSEVLIIALAEFKSKSHRDKVFKLMHKDPTLEKFMNNSKVDVDRMMVGGFKGLVNLSHSQK
jgi:uncharacterized protein YbaA (DUF1428 family)